MTGTMTGRAVGAPLERLYDELQRLRTKAGNVSYGKIVTRNKLGLRKTTIAAIFTGTGRKGCPSWANVACVFEVLREELAKTGVDPDAHLGTLERLYQLWEEVSGSPAEAAAPPSAHAPEKSVAADLPTPAPEPELAAVVTLPVATVPVATVQAAAAPTIARPWSPRTAPWPEAEDLPPATPSAHGESDLLTDLPSHQPLEQEAALALLSTTPWGQATADRMRLWFGPLGLELHAHIEDGQALATFELGVLLVNHDAIQEGLLLLEQASRLDHELLLTLPSMHIGDRFYGAIVRDISRRVATAYGRAGYRSSERMWTDYTRKIDARVPLAVLQHRLAHGRHASGRCVVSLSELELQRIKRAYWRARFLDDGGILDDIDDADLPTMPLPAITAARAAQLLSTNSGG